MILKLTSRAPDATAFTLVDDGATATGYDLLVNSSFGSPVWEHQFSGYRGTQGARPSQGRLPNRQVELWLRVSGASKNAVAAKLSDLADVVDDMRRYGGTLRWRSRSQTYYQNADVLTAVIELPNHDNRLEQINRAVVIVRLTCGPYMLGDPMDVSDSFTTDNVNGGEANYTADAGALSNVAVSGGVLDASANLTTENRMIYTGNGYTYGDHEATVRFAPGSTISSFKCGVVLKRIDASNYLAVYVDDNGANSRLRIDKVVAGATTNLASTNLAARVVNGQNAWVRGRIEGNVVYAEHFLYSTLPTATATPTTSTSIALTTAEAATFGVGVEGRAGIVFTPQQTAAFVDDFEILPFTYRSPPIYVLDCYGAIPGDAPALASARLGLPSTLNEAVWGLFAWSSRSGVENWVQRRYAGNTSGAPWVVSAVAGVTGAATSISGESAATVGAPAKYGTYVLQVVTPATANTGAHIEIFRRFRKGITYTATAWLRSNAGTTTSRIRLGVSGDIASSTAVALSTTWTQHTATWTPTADVDVAYLAIEVTAATATTFQIDGPAVYTGSTAPVGQQLQGLGASPPLCTFRGEGSWNGYTSTSRTANATANGAFASGASMGVGSTSNGWSFSIDTSLMPADDYSQDTVAVEVWGRVYVSAAFTGGVTAYLSAFRQGASGTTVASTTVSEGYSLAAPKTLVLPSSGNVWRMVRLGTLNLTRNAAGAKWNVTLNITVAAGTNLQPLYLDDLYVVPARSRLLGVSGKDATDGYPSFIEPETISKTIGPDLSGTTQIDSGGAITTNVSSGAGGALLELPPGQISVFGIASDLVPDDPTSTTDSETQAFPHLHLAVVPRWHWLRDA